MGGKSSSRVASPALDGQLYEAVRTGQVEIVQHLIDCGARPCKAESNSDPHKILDLFSAATIRASRVSDYDLEQLAKRTLTVIQEGCKDMNIFPQGVQSLIEDYCVFGRLDSLRWLYQSGLKPMSDVRSGIFDALDRGDVEAIEVMLKYEGLALVQKRACESYSDTTLSVLRYAVRAHCFDRQDWSDSVRCVRLLLESKADVSEPGLLDDVFMCNYNYDIVVALVQSGAPCRLSPKCNPLWYIISSNSLPEAEKIIAVEFLVDNGLLQKSHHNFEGYGQNPMCMPVYVPPSAVEYATSKKELQLAALLQQLL